MEEVTTCKSCGGQSWHIYRDRIECTQCGKTYSFGTDDYELGLKARDVMSLVNDRH